MPVAEQQGAYVQIKACEHKTERRRLHGHGKPCEVPFSRARGHHRRAPSFRTWAVIAFPHAPQRLSTVRLVFGLASAFKDDKARETFKKRLASEVGVAAKAVDVGCCTEDVDGLQDTAVTIGPLPTAEADDVAAQLRACTSDLAKTGQLLQIDVKHTSEPTLETCRWSFCEQVLHAAVSAVNLTFVGPKGCQSRLERCAMAFFKEDGDLALRPHVLFNWLVFRQRRDGEAFTFEGKPLSKSYAAVQKMITDFDARTKILESAHKVLNTAIERCTEASDIANVRVGAQSAAHSAVADDAEAEARKGEELAPHMVHCAVLDRHDQHEGQVLDGLSAMCRSERLATYVDPVDIAPDGKMLNDGERKDDPLVMQRGNFALDDYGTPCRHNLLSPRAVASPHVMSCPRATAQRAAPRCCTSPTGTCLF